MPTTLDAGLQARLEPLAARVAQTQGPEATAAILVVEIKGRAVRGAVGSGGLARPGGWIDMTRALRSPGSTLTPFIYAFAFEQGLAAPDTEIFAADPAGASQRFTMAELLPAGFVLEE